MYRRTLWFTNLQTMALRATTYTSLKQSPAEVIFGFRLGSTILQVQQ